MIEASSRDVSRLIFGAKGLAIPGPNGDTHQILQNFPRARLAIGSVPASRHEPSLLVAFTVGFLLFFLSFLLEP